MRKQVKVWHLIVTSILVLVIGVAASAGANQKTGPRGLVGPRGPAGVAGPEGPQGPKGDRGPKGPKGDKGDAGASAPAPAPAPASATSSTSSSAASGGSNITDGTWQVGTDIQPGTYSAQGGGGCYWEIDSSPPSNSDNSNNIKDNGFGDTHPVVTLASGDWFKTDSCGSWH